MSHESKIVSPEREIEVLLRCANRARSRGDLWLADECLAEIIRIHVRTALDRGVTHYVDISSSDDERQGATYLDVGGYYAYPSDSK